MYDAHKERNDITYDVGPKKNVRLHARGVVLQTAIHKGVTWHSARALTPPPVGAGPRSLGRGSDEGEGKNSPRGEKTLGQTEGSPKVLK